MIKDLCSLPLDITVAPLIESRPSARDTGMSEPAEAPADVRGDEMLPAEVLAAAAHPPDPPSGRASFQPFAPAEHHVVEACRSVKGDAVWVAWLGYPKSRNC